MILSAVLNPFWGAGSETKAANSAFLDCTPEAICSNINLGGTSLQDHLGVFSDPHACLSYTPDGLTWLLEIPALFTRGSGSLDCQKFKRMKLGKIPQFSRFQGSRDNQSFKIRYETLAVKYRPDFPFLYYCFDAIWVPPTWFLIWAFSAHTGASAVSFAWIYCTSSGNKTYLFHLFGM